MSCWKASPEYCAARRYRDGRDWTVTCSRSKPGSALSELQSISATSPPLLVVGGGESVEVGAGNELVTLDGDVEVVVTVVSGGDTTGAVAWVDVDVDLGVDVDTIVASSVTTVSVPAVEDRVDVDVDVESDESPPPRHDVIAGTSSATSTTLLRTITRSIMSLRADELAAMRENDSRFEIARSIIHTGCDSTSKGQESP
jgi:hypothetical protein